MKRKYSDPLVFPAIMLSSGGIDIGDTSNEGDPTDPDAGYTRSMQGLSVNDQAMPANTGDGMLLENTEAVEPAVVIEDIPIPAEEPSTVMDVLSSEETTAEPPATAE